MSKTKCAIYVRKSTEKGLEQEFNSLQNQEEACRNYILSQTFQGWEHYKTYTDGGISGGTMARPSLQEMLEDMRAGKIQCILVYKVDRLSRSIYDFKKMMKEFEKLDCNLVSITQSFDTSTAMGKLTLNMLLSFAEFEREVASERVRDKMRATKAKGMWVGGVPPLGYDVEFKRLVVNPGEAAKLKEIFETYLSVSSMSELRQALIEKSITGKVWTTASGETKGGGHICVSALARMLGNTLYIGKMPNKVSKEEFDGQHEAIIDKDLFEAVQKKIADNHRHGANAPYSRGTSLLFKKLMTANGEEFKNTRGNKGVKKYRYYTAKACSLPAGDIENVVRDTVQKFLDSDMTCLPDDKRMAFKQIEYKDELIQPMIEKAVYQKNKMALFINIADLSYLAGFKTDRINTSAEPMAGCYASEDGNFAIVEREILVGKNMTNACAYQGGGVTIMTKSENATSLTRALAYAWRYKKLYEAGTEIPVIAKNEHKDKRTIYKYISLGYLSPKIVNAVMDEKIPAHIDLQALFGIASNDTFAEQEQAYFNI